MVQADQRERLYRFVREMRSKKPLFTLDFQNDGEFVGGCIAGGGQPLSQLPPTEEGRQARVAAMRAQDRQDLRSSHESREARNVYETFLGEPCGEKAEALLHTSFQDRHQAFAAKAQPERRI